MAVHYRFNSTPVVSTIAFDGLYISVEDLRKEILRKLHVNKNVHFDLRIQNADTKEYYDDDKTLIIKNTCVVLYRVPSNVNQKSCNDKAEASLYENSEVKSKLVNQTDLARIKGSENDKIQAMMDQSTSMYHPSRYSNIRYSRQSGAVPEHYRCRKCRGSGHWIKNCPLAAMGVKKSTGIPRSFMVPVDGPSVPGARLTPRGTFAVPYTFRDALKDLEKLKMMKKQRRQ